MGAHGTSVSTQLHLLWPMTTLKLQISMIFGQKLSTTKMTAQQLDGCGSWSIYDDVHRRRFGSPPSTWLSSCLSYLLQTLALCSPSTLLGRLVRRMICGMTPRKSRLPYRLLLPMSSRSLRAKRISWHKDSLCHPEWKLCSNSVMMPVVTYLDCRRPATKQGGISNVSIIMSFLELPPPKDMEEYNFGLQSNSLADWRSLLSSSKSSTTMHSSWLLPFNILPL